MRDAKEIWEMAMVALNAATNIDGKTKAQRIRMDKLFCFAQVLDWILYDSEERDKALRDRIERLRIGEEK